ncbi:MAG: hypothetical protein CM15mP98_09910 [Paracoccaceae bacterium]|nr:MAG: hypothetical protein CM15mP98_09910 [Paracoccaceae bacterium]
MQPLEEKDSSPLEDTEITRLIKVSRELGYKKQDKIPERNLDHFKPTSITQIASSSDHKVKETIDDSESADLAEKKIEEKTSADDNLPADKLNSEPVNTDPNSQSTLEQKEISDPSDNSSTARSETPATPSESDITPSASNKVDQEDTSSDNGTEAGSTQGTAAEKDTFKEDPIVPTRQNESYSMEEAKQEGIEIGKKIAFTELENKQKEALEAFQVIIDNIKNKETVDKTDLTESILRVITRLASERAGAMIDESSDTFKNKIISFADKIEQASKNLILNLNPIDANLLSKTLAESLSDKKVEIRENSELFRGDFIFQMGAVEIGDLISEQILILDEEKEATEESNKSGIESEEVGSADKEVPQKTEKESMSEIDNDKK